MLTRCPHCQTAFRITPEQLKARQGRVRCGACRAVFDALDTLADEVQTLAVARLPPPAPDPVAEIKEVDFELDADSPATPTAPVAEIIPEPDPAPESKPEETSPASAADNESRRWQDGAANEAADTSADAPAANAAVNTPVPDEMIDVADEWESVALSPPPRRWPWITGLLLLLTLAAAQLLFIFRVELAVLVPELRPVLVAGCDRLGCTLPRPRKPELVSIEASDLAPASSGRLLLTATLKNRAPFDQEFPHLELTLTDTGDVALLRKVLAPADYLPADQTPAAGFPARGELALKLTLEAPSVPAVGYRLYLFFP